jgi:hypothetical protein
MIETCVWCDNFLGRFFTCPGRATNGRCESVRQYRARRAREEAARHARHHHYIDPMARALLVAEYIRNGNIDQAMRVIRETAEHAHENALHGFGPLGQ